MPLRQCLIGLGVCAGLAFASSAWGQPPNLGALHDALHLTSSQEAAWGAYQASVSAPATAEQRHRAAAELFPKLSAPRRIDLVEADMEQDLTDVRRQGVALKAFYATLQPEQQRIFDAQTLPPAQGSGNGGR
jgi:hypothetical protein